MDETATARIGFLIKRAQAVLHEAMVDALAPLRLTIPQYAALTALREEPGLSNADLSRRAFVTPQTMHAVLADLENRELLVRHPHPEHRRVLRAELTRSGRRLLQTAALAVDAVEDRMLRDLSDTSRSRLASGLATCIDALGE
jgi:DNA-binding MarR family transcriptional regulator